MHALRADQQQENREEQRSPLSELADDHHRPERLLMSDEHVVRDVSEDGRVHEETCNNDVTRCHVMYVR